MYERICKNCNKPSYSATARGIWICPYCGKKIEKVKLGSSKKNKIVAKGKPMFPAKIEAHGVLTVVDSNGNKK